MREITRRAYQPVSFALMSALQGIAAVVFDLDDTLCGYWDASKAALRQTFEELSPTGVSSEELYVCWATAFRRFSKDLKETDWYPIYLKLGEPSRTEQMRLALLEAGIEDPELARTLGDRYAELRDTNLNLFPEALQVLESLRGRFKLGLLTNGPADIQNQEVDTCGIRGFFDAICIEGEMGRGKPLMEVFRHCEVLLDMTSDQILFVGNSYAHDIRPGIEAGWKTAWVRRPSDVSPSSGKPEERPPGTPKPDFEINDLRELSGILGLS